MSSLKFIDLFAGLGGFHIGLEKLGHQCVFASEKKGVLAELYSENFQIEPNRDINTINAHDVPSHDILCAGFPCQPFSKAGDQKGLDDENNGNLFYRIYDILNYHSPKYFILENVANLERHDSGNTWKTIKELLVDELKYSVDSHILSPHDVGIPQHRQRMFIVGCKNGLNHFRWPKVQNVDLNIESYLDKKVTHPVEPMKKYVLSLWQEFIECLPKSCKMPSFPIWSMEFGANYPYEYKTPFNTANNELEHLKGSFGHPLLGIPKNEKLKLLPAYAQSKDQEFPKWKKRYIKNNREFYLEYKECIDPVLKKIKALGMPSWQKFEWNFKDGNRNIAEHIVQFRGSGVRVKKFDYFPSLVTVKTQIPIVAREERYISPREGARIQSLNGIKLPENIGTCFNALGNAVNAKLVTLIAQNLIHE